MHTFLLVAVTSGLVLLQTTQGLTANLEPDADFIEEAEADGFIVGTTKGPPKTEKPQDNYNTIVTHDSLNPDANLPLFQKDSLPIVSIAKTPEANTALIENANKRPKNYSVAVLIQEENVEGSGIFPEWGTTETVDEVDISSDGSGMFSLNKKQNEDLTFTTSVRNSVNLNISTPSYNSSDENSESGTEREAPTSDLLTTNLIEDNVLSVHENSEVAVEKPTDESSPDPAEEVPVQSKPRNIKNPGYDPDPTSSALAFGGTPGWLLILALCLVLGAVILVFVAIGTKDMWYGPSRQCLNINSTESKKHEEYDKAATLPLSEKEMVALMSAQKGGVDKTDCTISIVEPVPEKEYLM